MLENAQFHNLGAEECAGIFNCEYITFPANINRTIPSHGGSYPEYTVIWVPCGLAILSVGLSWVQVGKAHMDLPSRNLGGSHLHPVWEPNWTLASLNCPTSDKTYIWVQTEPGGTHPGFSWPNP